MEYEKRKEKKKKALSRNVEVSFEILRSRYGSQTEEFGVKLQMQSSDPEMTQNNS